MWAVTGGDDPDAFYALAGRSGGGSVPEVCIGVFCFVLQLCSMWYGIFCSGGGGGEGGGGGGSVPEVRLALCA